MALFPFGVACGLYVLRDFDLIRYQLLYPIFLELVNTKAAVSTMSFLLFAMWLQNCGKVF
jgi:hypothetical protein